MKQKHNGARAGREAAQEEEGEGEGGCLSRCMRCGGWALVKRTRTRTHREGLGGGGESKKDGGQPEKRKRSLSFKR